MRNEEKGAGHGQGSEINIIPEELAELGVHLSGVLIHFLVKRHIIISQQLTMRERCRIISSL